MAQPGITLDGIAFHWTANPEQVKFGLKEQIVIHKMIGGARILDMLGDDPEDITWSAFFLGPNAVDLAQQLYALQQTKTLLNLTFGLYNATVVISQLDLVYKKAFWVDYSITCIVVDQAEGAGFGDAAGNADIGNPFDGDIAIAAANVQLANLNNAVDAVAGLNAGIAGFANAINAVVGVIFQ